MRFDREQWRRLYINESADHRALPLLARGVRDYLIRVARQQDGVLVKNAPTEERAIETLLRGCSAHAEEMELATKYIQLWIDDGYLVWRRSKNRYALGIKRYVEAQKARSPGAVRQKRYRDRHTPQKTNHSMQLPLPSVPVTGDVTGNATGNVTRLDGVTSQRKKERSERSERKKERHEVSDRAAEWLTSPDGQFSHGSPHQWPEVVAVVAACNDVWGQTTRIHNSADPRIAVVVERLAEGFSPDDLIEAIHGSRNDEWIASKKGLQTLKTLLKDAASVDKYASMIDGDGAVPGVQPSVNSEYYKTGKTGWEPAAESGPVEELSGDERPFGKQAADA